MSRRAPGAGVYRVARSKDTVYVRLIGLGTMNNSKAFEEFLENMRQQGYGQFVVDLDECRGVDSTFMGILAGLASEGVSSLVVLNASRHCQKQLCSVGLHQLLTLETRPADLPTGVVLHELPSAAANALERLKLIMRAHEALIRVDQKNEKTFGAFLRGIVQDLSRREGTA